MQGAWIRRGLAIGAAAATMAAVFSAGGRADDEPKIVPVASTAGPTGTKLPAQSDEKGPRGPKAARAAVGFTPEREAAAMTFVRTHHPELANLLTRLKDRRPGEYQKAIRDLFRVSERLAQSQEVQPLRYELELESWKLGSRIQVLVARLTMDRSPELERQLRELLARQLEVHEKIVKLDRDRAAERVKSFDAELARLASDREQVLEEKFQKALRSAGEKKQQLKATKDPPKPEPRTPKPDPK